MGPKSADGPPRSQASPAQTRVPLLETIAQGPAPLVISVAEPASAGSPLKGLQPFWARPLARP
jgi:hypothetical protein